MRAGLRHVGIMNLSQLAAGPVQFLLLPPAGLALFLDSFAVAMLQVHQLLDERTKLFFVGQGIQSLRDLDDPRLQAGFGRLVLLDMRPRARLNGFAFIDGEPTPLRVERGEFLSRAHGL